MSIATVAAGLVVRASPFRLYFYGAAAALVLGAIGTQTWRLHTAQAELATERAARATEKAAASESARHTEAAYRAEERRVAIAHKEVEIESAKRTLAALDDAVSSADARDRLLRRLDATVAAARQAAGDPQAVAGRTPAGDPIRVLADVLGRADARAGLLARLADTRGLAGSLCEREYDALTP